MNLEKLFTPKLLIMLMQFFVACIVLVFPALLIYLFVFVLYVGEDLEIQNAIDIPQTALGVDLTCTAEQELGQAGKSSMKTPSGFRYFVKTPLNYSSEQAWPVMIVFSPAMGGSFMEAYTGLTGPLTKAGFIVAYVDSVPINIKMISSMAEIIDDVDTHWCIDKNKVFVGGHSNGATIAQALNFLSDIKIKSEIHLAGFISSAAGLQKEDLQNYACPSEPTKAFILHNNGDTHFLNFGLGAAEWWAACNQCKKKEIKNIEEGCFVYSGCKKGGEVKFCEQPGSHLKWPERRTEMVEFLK